MGHATSQDAGAKGQLNRQSMNRLPPLLRRTFTPRVIPLEGGFAGLFQLDFANHLFARRYEDPVLVSCTDGVGSKLKVAQLAGRHNTVGIDLVAMSVNDALCCGAEPLFFLDYVALSHDDPPLLEQIVSGISEGCLQADCALLGGETAILPDTYHPGDYDLAGFCVGVVERTKVIDGRLIAPDDVLIGVASRGLHSNGYSLVRKIVFDVAGLKITDEIEELGGTSFLPRPAAGEGRSEGAPSVGDVLLTPTRIYARAVRHILSHYTVKEVVHGIAHITGGGLLENLARIIPDGRRAIVRRNGWPVPPVFTWLQKLGDVDQAEMDRTFNLGLGLVLVVSPYYAESIRDQLANCDIASWPIGRIIDASQGADWE
jgi:phosphoribosylformylglycinamidine cyclo-ligase